MNNAINDAKLNRAGLKLDRKAEEWKEVTSTVPADRLPADLPVYDADAMGIRWQVMNDFKHEPGAQYFIVTVGADRYLVNTEGYNFAKYVAKVVS